MNLVGVSPKSDGDVSVTPTALGARESFREFSESDVETPTDIPVDGPGEAVADHLRDTSADREDPTRNR
jgi:hypothetical protein